MAREWWVDGSHADYWRSDNPLINAWYRCGDAPPENNFQSNTEKGVNNFLSGLLVDSSHRKHHLREYIFSPITVDQIIRPVPGIAPWATGGSGMQFLWDESDNHAIFARQEHAVQHGPAATYDRGDLGPGLVSYSGFTIIGWAQIPELTTIGTPRYIAARDDQDTSLATQSLWQLFWIENPAGRYALGALFLTQANMTFNGQSTALTRVTQTDRILSDQEPYFPTNRDEPFWFAWKFHRESAQDERSYDENGSGLITLYIGTEQSGLIAKKENLIIGPDIDLTFARPGQDGVPFTLGCSSRFNSSSLNTLRRLPPSSILDEVVMVNDNLSDERIIYYALSGMTHVTTSDAQHPDFVPEFPGTDDLQCYWSFDNDLGTNTAPATQNDPRFDISLSGTNAPPEFIDGIRGGRGLRVAVNSTDFNNSVDPKNAMNLGYPKIVSQSGFPDLFPRNGLNGGMTWIGWMRHPGVSPSFVNVFGGAFGWFGSDNNFLAFGTDGINSAIVNTNNVLDFHYLPSGISISTNLTRSTTLPGNNGSVDSLNSAVGASYLSTNFNDVYDIGDTDWHLWAGIIDFVTGTAYLVRDAKFLVLATQLWNPASGFIENGFGEEQGFFGWVNRENTSPVEIDDWAVYNKILTLPEMSGFAINGILSAPLDAELASSQRNLVGYWPLNTFTNYDPTGISGFRVDDLSWYSHHLTNISGLFSTGARLNTENSDYSSSIKVDLSGSMISLERQFHGHLLDGSDEVTFANSGIAAGAWIYIPSGNSVTVNNTSDGLFGTHMIMGSYNTVEQDSSWFIGIENNRLALKFVENNGTQTNFQSTLEPTYNEPFFVGGQFFPSGSTGTIAQLVKIGSDSTSTVQYGVDSVFSSIGITANPTSASGFSLLNAPGADWGFPSGTRIQHAFVNLGYLNEDRWLRFKRSQIVVQNESETTVSSTDPDNISHWKMDFAGAQISDDGKENNDLYPFGTDGGVVSVLPAIHGSGAFVGEDAYLDTRAGNPNSRRLDLGSGNQSWTILGWLRAPDAPDITEQRTILNKGSGPADNPSGVRIFTAPSSSDIVCSASGGIAAGTQNGPLIKGAWNHLGITYDRESNQFGVTLNGRYAGTSFEQLVEIPTNNSGLALGGLGSDIFDPVTGGGSFSGIFDDWMLFSRALTLPEISGLAANSYNYVETPNEPESAFFGAFISGVPQFFISGLIGTFFHGVAQDLELVGGTISGVRGETNQYGGTIHGRAFISGIIGSYLHGLDTLSGVHGAFLRGRDFVSGIVGSYTFGAGEASSEFDITFNYRIVEALNFDARVEVINSDNALFDALIAIQRITAPPLCILKEPVVGLIASGLPYELTVSGSGIAFEDKRVEKVRFTFADFKGAESGTRIDGNVNSGLYSATRVFDTPGWYTVKMEVVDTFGYRGTCARPFLLVPSGSTSGQYLDTLPGIELTASPVSGSAIARVLFDYSLSGLANTSGILEYTDFADQKETLVNGSEFPEGTNFTNFVRTHDYTVPGRYSPVWAVSGTWGVISDSISPGIDYLS